MPGFPGGSDSKEYTCNVGNVGLIPGLGRCPGGAHGNPLQYSCLENPQGQRSLVGYSPWGCTELDTTEQLHFHLATPVVLPGESHGLRSLVGYSPWGHQESDTTERLNFLIF